MAASPPISGIDLYWLPLGAGGHSVRLNGRIYEAVASRLANRPARDLYHSALEVWVPEGRFVIEQAPIRDSDGAKRGVVAEGAVGTRAAGRFRLFRYEVRRWRDGIIPDVAEAVESPHRLSDDPDRARRLLELVPQVPTPVWGRDELHAGEMWNSNSVIAWLVARSGLDVESIQPPPGGRAPGWRAGIITARGLESPLEGRRNLSASARRRPGLSASHGRDLPQQSSAAPPMASELTAPRLREKVEREHEPRPRRKEWRCASYSKSEEWSPPRS